MKILFSCIVGVLLLISTSASSQWVADEKCYYPDFNDKTEVDFRHGTYENQYLGDFFRLPPKPGSTKTRLAIIGLSIDSAKYGSRFDVIDPNVAFSVQNPKIEGTFIVGEGAQYPPQRQYGHFRNSKDVDMLIDMGGYLFIYWADENGLYDTARRIYINTYKSPDGKYYEIQGIKPIVTRYSADTVDDIIVGLQRHVEDSTIRDSNFLSVYYGGSKLYEHGDFPTPDEIYFSNTFDHVGYIANRRTVKQGDFRGTGNQDILALDEWSNIFFYKREGKFNPQEFLRAMQEDTILIGRDHLLRVHPQGNPVDFDYAKIERVLDKPSWDSSKDFIFWYVINKDDGLGRISILKGGTDFGKYRIHLDTVSTIYDLKEIDPSYLFTSPSYNIFVGQLTRSPNTNKYLIVNYTEGSLIGFNHLYMLGDAFDNQADMIFENLPSAYFATDWDTVDANGDQYLDLFFGAPSFGYPEQQKYGYGSIGILYGSSKIPHQIKNAVKDAPKNNSASDIHISSLKNGILEVEVSLTEGENISLEIRDILGRLITERKDISYYGRRVSFYLRGHASGTYFIILKDSNSQVTKKFFLTN